MTEDEAKTKFCPMTFARESCDDHWNCCSSGCMAWRWSQEAPKPSPQITWWPKTEDDKILRSIAGPEEERPTGAIGADWIPLSGNDKDENWEGGYWRETTAKFEQRANDIRSKRQGFCGAYGPALTQPSVEGARHD